MNIISSFNLDLSDIKQDGENRKFTILGSDGAVFSLEIKNEDGYYYNFQNALFQAQKTRLDNISISQGSYSAFFKTPTVSDADKYDIYLFAEKDTKHASYNEVRASDGSIDINLSTGSNSNLLQKVIYQTLDVTITISNSFGTAASRTNEAIIGSRGKSVIKTSFTTTATLTSGAYSINRQPTSDDVETNKNIVIGSPVDIYNENIYPTARDAFTGDDINGAVTSGTTVDTDATDISANIGVGDKITTTVMTDTVNGARDTSAVAITMDSAVATKMAVGDRVTGNADLDAGVFTVASLDSTNVFSISAVVAIADGVTLSFSSKINRSVTTVQSFPGDASAFVISQAIQFRDNAPLTFSPRKNYRWAVDNIENLDAGMSVITTAGNGFVKGANIADYLDQTTIFENEINEQKITNVSVPALDTLSALSTITRNGTTNVATTVQTGNVVFDAQALRAFTGETIAVYAYGLNKINVLSGYDVEFSNLKAELNTITTTTTAASIASTTVPVTSKLGIAPKGTQTVDGATILSNTVVLDSVAGLGIGQSLYAVSSGTLTGIPTITAIDETNKKITLSSPQTFADGITLTFPFSIISGIGIDASAVNPYVDTISSLDLTASAAQTLENAQTFTFSGAGSVLTITGDIEINKVGNADVTLSFDLEKFITKLTN